jgi:ubiquinone/menaquinone biosynthesis C-methylase UbiE
METPNERIVSLYSLAAPVYDAWTRFTESRSLDVALERVGIRDGEAVLEVAVGTGVFFREVLRRNPSGRNVGVDLTEGMLRRARRKAQRSGVRHELLVADARALPFDDATFDVVVCNNMLGIVPESSRAAIVREISRLTKPRGRLAIVMMMRPANRGARLVYGIGAVHLGGWSDVDVEPLVRDAGFGEIRRERVSQLGIPSDVLFALRDARPRDPTAQRRERSSSTS